MVNHILLECAFAQYSWCCIRDAFGLEGFPLWIQEALRGLSAVDTGGDRWLPRRLGIPKRVCFSFSFAGLAWAIWKNMNKMAIKKNLISN